MLVNSANLVLIAIVIAGLTEASVSQKEFKMGVIKCLRPVTPAAAFFVNQNT